MAYAVNSEFARVYGDMGTGVWVAGKGTTLPTTLATDPAGFDPVGWLDESGVDLTIDKDTKEFHALQGGSMIRKKVGKVGQKFKFICLEETALVLSLVHAGNQPVVTQGVAKLDIGTNQNRTVEKAIVVDLFDGTVQKRYNISAADLTYQGTIKIGSNSDITAYEFEATIIAGAEAHLLTNSPGVVAV